MSTKADLKRAMLEHGHKVPMAPAVDIKLHYNKLNGKMWCYCESCHALAGLDNGRVFGAATTRQCNGNAKAPRANAYMTI